MATTVESDTKSKPARTLIVDGVELDRDKVIAQTALRPSVQGAVSVQQWSKGFGELDLTQLAEELRAQSSAATEGKLARGEAMLMVQAHTLDLIFNELGQRAARNAGQYLDACETYLRLALKAQSQCRATLETLALMKNPPPTTFVRQANIANNQQVNNVARGLEEPSRARENESQPNKLLESAHGDRLECGAPLTASSVDPQMATVGTINGAKNNGR